MWPIVSEIQEIHSNVSLKKKKKLHVQIRYIFVSGTFIGIHTTHVTMYINLHIKKKQNPSY